MVSPKAVTEALSPEVPAQQALLQLARRIRKGVRPICGFWPIRGFWSIRSGFGSPNFCIGLAKALASLGDSTGIILRQQDWQEALPDARTSIQVLSDGVDSITPVRSPSGISPTLEHVLAAVRDRYAYVLLDLTGLDIVSVSEIALLPDMGIILLMPPGGASEFALARLRRRLPLDRLLGAVLVDQPRAVAK